MLMPRVNLLKEFKDETAFVIIKHTNACGVATASSVKEAYLKAFQADTHFCLWRCISD